MAGRITTITNLSFSYIIQNLSRANYIYRGARVVHVLVRVLDLLPPLWPRFKSWCQHRMWVEFVVGALLCFERLFFMYSSFPLLLKTISFSNFNSTRKSSGWIEEPLSRCATSKLLFIYILIYWKVSMFWRLFWLIISWTLTFMKLLGSRPGTNESFE